MSLPPNVLRGRPSRRESDRALPLGRSDPRTALCFDFPFRSGRSGRKRSFAGRGLRVLLPYTEGLNRQT